MSEHDHLYDVSIDMLELSEEIHDFLVKRGITSVGDCIDYSEVLPPGIMLNPPRPSELVSQLRQALITQKYINDEA